MTSYVLPWLSTGGGAKTNQALTFRTSSTPKPQPATPLAPPPEPLKYPCADMWSDATVLPWVGELTTLAVSSNTLTSETDEPTHAGILIPPSRSGWWTFTADETCILSLDSHVSALVGGGNADTVLAIYGGGETGSDALNKMVEVSSNDDDVFTPPSKTSAVAVFLPKGSKVWIAIAVALDAPDTKLALHYTVRIVP